MEPTRADALATLQDGDRRLTELLAGLSSEELVRGATIGGGDWSAKDLIGHIAFWEEIALATIDPWLRGERPPIEETFTGGDADALNAWNQDRKRSWSVERVRATSGETHRRLIAAIEGMTPEGWALPRAFPDDDDASDLASELGAVLGAPGRPFGHAFAHVPDLEAYVAGLRRSD
jgi:hypothetical protein